MSAVPTLTHDEWVKVLCSPSLFCRVVLGWTSLIKKQCDILDSMKERGASTSVVTCNESGKTSKIIAGLILWHMMAYPKGWIVSTSGSFRQVTSQLMPSLRSFSGQFANQLEFLSNTIVCKEDGEARYMGFSTKEGGRFEGYHSGDLKRGEDLLVIFDEAKTIPDRIFEAGDRCNPTRTIYLSSPGSPTGMFHKSHTHPEIKKLFKRFKIVAAECPWISKESIEKRKIKWKGNPQLLASMIDAEFMEAVEDCLMTAGDVDACIYDPPQQRGEDQQGFCDFAAGGDENVFARRVGNRVEIADAWRDKNTSAAVGRFIKNFNQYGMRPNQLAGDADGLGIVMINNLRDCGWPIFPFHGGSPARLPQYKNAVSETWQEGALAVKACDIILPEDDELRGQLISRKSKTDAKGKLWLESKDDMKGRGLPSPDRADAVLGCLRKMAGPMTMREKQEDLYGKAFLSEGKPEDQNGDRDEEVMAGFNV